MTDAPPPSSTPPGPVPSPPAGSVPSPPPSAPAPPPAPPPRKGLSSGAKIAIGCGVILLLVLILIFACFGLVGKKVSDVGDAMEKQAESSRMAEALEREHPFTPPPDGTLEEDQVEAFFAVTDDVWSEIEDLVRDLEERGIHLSESGSRAGFGDAVAAVEGLSAARVALVEALDEHEMAPGAYVWTGFTLLRAKDALSSGGAASGVPQKNLELARKHADRLAELEEREAEEADRGAVLALAFVLFPRMDVFPPAWIDSVPSEER